MAVLVPSLLESLSSLEHQVSSRTELELNTRITPPSLPPPSLSPSLPLPLKKLNTYSLIFSGERQVQEKLDDLRVAASRSSPMMETVQLCVQQVGPEELVSLVPRLVDVMKSGVGLATKVSSAQFVVLLTHHSLHTLTPFAGRD